MAVEERTLPSIEDFLALARTRRSIRGYDPTRDVPDAVIEQIIEAARWAPSGGNGQPWHFVIIRDAADRAYNAELFLKQQEHKAEMERAARGQVRLTGAGFKNAPVHILVVGDPRVNESYPIRTKLEKSARHFYSGLANATLSLMFAARCLGLATQYVSDAGSPYMGTLLNVRYGIPDPLEVYELVPLGYPSSDVAPTPRRPLASMIHQGRFEADKLLSDTDMKHWLWKDSRLGAYGKGPSQGAIQAGVADAE
ncbi:MAG TPA: nitroreductase family protein [Chloroflexota bacterium]|nr:nitroreductase family protein [Chloroflexota bacterium]